MGILADIGRSNISGELGKLGAFIREQKDQALRERESQLGEMRFEREGQTHELNLRQMTKQVKQEEEQIKYSNRFIDVTTLPAYQLASPEAQKMYLDYAKSQGYIDENNRGRAWQVNQSAQDIDSQSKLFKPFGDTQVESYKRNWQTLKEERETMEQKFTEAGKAEELAKDKKYMLLRQREEQAKD